MEAEPFYSLSVYYYLPVLLGIHYKVGVLITTFDHYPYNYI